MLKQALLRPFEYFKGEPTQATCPKRRNFLKLAAVSAGGLAASPALAHVTYNRERNLNFYNPRTGETLKTVYWTPREGYLNESLREISWLLRDFRNDQVKLFDPKLMDQLYALRLKLDYKKLFYVISGYRSPETNTMLRQRSRGVAKNSYHLRAMAADIRLPGRDIADLHKIALSLRGGGVGYYPRSNFIHLDTGPVRSWRG